MQNNTITIPRERNNSVDIARLVLAVLVIAIHVDLFGDVNEVLKNIVTDFLTRVAVPFFLCVSGYYAIQSMLGGGFRLGRQLKNILRPYITWTLIYYTASFVVTVILGKTPITAFLTERVVFFFTKGSYIHLWYFPALIYSLLTTALVFRLFGRKGLTILSTVTLVLCLLGALGTAYLPLGSNIPVLSSIYNYKNFETIRRIFCMGFAFFTSGYWIVRWQEWAKSRKHCSVHYLLGLSIVVYLVEISILVFVLHWIKNPELMFSNYLITVTLMGTLLLHPMASRQKTGWYAKWLSSFVYYVHPLFIAIYVAAQGALNISVNSIVMFFIVLIPSLLFGFFCLRLNNRLARALLGKAPEISKKTKRLQAEDQQEVV